MKKFLSVCCFLFALLPLIAQQSDNVCRSGFVYEISDNPNWGYNKPIIMKVYPYSAAETAGLKQDDIIEKINGISVSDISLDDVDSLILDSDQMTLALTVRNFLSHETDIHIDKKCYSLRSLSEDRLADAFSMYSVESTHDRLFICPFITNNTKEMVDFSLFKTFDFMPLEDPSISKTERSVNEALKAELIKKGLRHNAVSPDFLIQTYYSFHRNSSFKGRGRNADETQKTYRYDIPRDRITRFPFYPSTTSESEAEYTLQLGVRFIDQSFVPGRVLWECEANELMSAAFSIDEYAAIHIPLMCMQFPYVKYSRNVQYILTKKNYYYTGIQYGIDRLNEVVGVDPGSPAEKAGIKVHDIIDFINDKRMDRTVEEFTATYHQFISNSLKYRDPETRFTDANGFPNRMLWDKFKNVQIAKMFDNDKNLTAFSYLYSFAPYINSKGSKILTFKVRRDRQKLEFIVRPDFHSEKTIELN